MPSNGGAPRRGLPLPPLSRPAPADAAAFQPAVVAAGTGAANPVALLLTVLAGACFLVSGGGSSLGPFLLPMSRDLGTDLAAIATLVSVMSVPWGLISIPAGSLSTRLGRRPVLIFGLFAFSSAWLGVAVSPTYPLILAFHLLGGVGGGCFMGTVFATVSDYVPNNQRGRALGWVITGQSLALVLGVPMLTFIGSFAGWRGALASQGLAALLAAAAVWLAVPSQRAAGAGLSPVGSSWRALKPSTLLLLSAGTMERIAFGSLTVYLSTYLISSYSVPLQTLAFGLALVALGNLAGNLVGGHLSDRVPSRSLLFAATLVTTGLLALPLLLWQPDLVVSLGLGFVYSFSNAMGRPALLATLSAGPSHERGTVLGLNVTFNSLGWISATALGGRLLVDHGFGALGLLSAGAGLLGATAVGLSWLLTRVERRGSASVGAS